MTYTSIPIMQMKKVLLTVNRQLIFQRQTQEIRIF